MPRIGDIKKAQEIGKVPINSKYTWVACGDCGRERWVHIIRGQPSSNRCKKCASKGRIATEETRLKMSLAMRTNPHLRFIDKTGYAWIHCYRENEFYPMSNKRNLILEHRLVMAQFLGRCLTPREHIHHKNGNRSDNRIENLELISQANHNLITTFCDDCKVKKGNRKLILQNRNLLNQIRELNLSFGVGK